VHGIHITVFCVPEKKKIQPVHCLRVQILILISQIISNLAGISFNDTIDEIVGEFVTVPFSEKFAFGSDPKNNPMPNPQKCSEIRLKKIHRTAEAAQQCFDKILRKPLNLLQQIFAEQNASEIISEDLFDIFAGISALNCREVRIYSPLHIFFEKVKNSSHSLAFMPLTLKMQSSFGGIPRVDVSALCPLYAAINHSCDYNTAVGKTEIEEFRSPENQCAMSFVYARRNLRKGEELFAAYVHVEENGVLLSERKSLLKENYLFECQCKLCKST